jgi:hypothetical protein
VSTIPTSEPRLIHAGDTLRFVRSVPDYPANEGWSLAYLLISAAQRYVFNATADGEGYAVAVPAADTAKWVSGDYKLIVRVSKGDEVHTIFEARATVAPDVTAAADLRTHEEKMLDAITSVLEGKATSDVQEYTVGGRSLKKIPFADLKKLQQEYIWLVRRQHGTAPQFAAMTFAPITPIWPGDLPKVSR